MMIFETERLTIRPLQLSDADAFFDMMGNPNVMNPIPQKVMTREESDANLNKFLNPKGVPGKQVWGIDEKSSGEFIGLCALLKNDENEDEIGYRLREKHWGNGYGTEIARGLISYSFEVLKFEKITADVNTKNITSIKILDKFLTPVKEFFNKNDNCTDRRYALERKDWK